MGVQADGRCTPLHKAAFHSKVGVVRLLLDSAVVVDPKDMVHTHYESVLGCPTSNGL